MTQGKPKIRLYVTDRLLAGGHVTLAGNPAHYVTNVMRADAGDAVLLFNGRDGEWLARLDTVGKKQVVVALERQTRPQSSAPDLRLAFAPIKNKTDTVVEKATELGVSAIIPVFTRYSVVKAINREKLEANIIEAAEQCERLDVPLLEKERDLPQLLAGWPEDRLLLYADEAGGGVPIRTFLTTLTARPLAVFIGPEGGFSAEERSALRTCSFVRPVSLGPRILRADTAAIAALACMQAWRGDWE